MSAIWGIIDLNKNKLSNKDNLLMKSGYEKCKIDKYSYIVEDNVIIGCGIQYITRESEQEILPYYDKEQNIFITADAIIDNREDLIKSLHCDNNVTDSQLIYKAFLKWGEDFPRYLLGCFTYVIYDKNNNKVFCGRDHVGSRSIYYSFTNGIFYFSTIIKPILLTKNKDIELNLRWINDYLAIEGLVHIVECKETIYKDIYNIEPSQYIKLENNKIQEITYWDPIKDVKKLKLKTDEEYGELFRETLNNSVKSAVRTNGNIGIMLSGGLDSSSIAYYASKNVNDKTIQGYTSVPLDDFTNTINKNFIVDESNLVNELCSQFKNINPNYCNFPDKNSYNTIEEIIDILEMPYKIIHNAYWINEVYKQASNDNCKILLNGQYGNATISFGNILIHLNTLLHQGNFLKFNNEIKAYCKKRKIGRKLLLCELVRNCIPFYSKLMYNNNSDKLININLYKSMNTKKRFSKLGIDVNSFKIKTLKKSRSFIFNKIGLSQVGEIETKMSLHNNIIVRDPTRDKRIIEFCLSLPTNQFVNNGVTRRLIRDYLKDYLPHNIIIDNGKRGLQSADWYYRLNQNWNNIFNDINNNLSKEYLYQYFNKDYIDKALFSLKDGININNEYEALNLIIASIFNIYIDKLKNIEGGNNHEKELEYSKN